MSKKLSLAVAQFKFQQIPIAVHQAHSKKRSKLPSSMDVDAGNACGAGQPFEARNPEIAFAMRASRAWVLN
ncbi:MAG: hypothetical protein KA956_10150, partial [Pyrinomonadaceae bacterium]|nr:hypothetical protein [Pyrinomonadaceae bacterium]